VPALVPVGSLDASPQATWQPLCPRVFLAAQTFTADSSISAEKETASGNLKVEFKHGAFSVDKLTVGTDRKVIGEFTLADAAPRTDLLFKYGGAAPAQ
jgi:hypothetical protein